MRRKGADWLAGRFEKREHIGKGGMADVWLATDHHDEPFSPDRRVALKILKSELAKDENSLRRFELEGRAMIGFAHANIATVFAQMSDGPDHFLVMEYIEGCSVGQLLERHRRSLPPGDAVDVVAQVCEGIEYAHRHEQGVIHRDVKPANVMLAGGYTEGERPRVKVADFGIARAKHGVNLTHTDAVLGTPAYMAPEVAEGKGATHSADVYGCGVMLYRLLTGVVPYAGDDPAEIQKRKLAGPPPAPATLDSAIPPAVSDATLVALERRPPARYESAGKMSLAIRAAWAGEDIDDFLPTRFLHRSERHTDPTQVRRRAPEYRALHRPREPWLPLLKFAATLGLLLVLLEVVLRLTTAIATLPVWVLAGAVLICGFIVLALRSPAFTASGIERKQARMKMRVWATSTLRAGVIVSLAAYWCLLGYHLTDTVRDRIERQPPPSHIWLELGTALLWIAAAALPLVWFRRSRMPVGRLVVVGAIVALAWTASAELMPEAPRAVASLFWPGGHSLQHRVVAEGKQWTKMLRHPDLRTRRSHVKALRRRLAASRNARLRALRQADSKGERHHARRGARDWVKSMRHARHAWHQPGCRHLDARLSIGATGARAICP